LGGIRTAATAAAGGRAHFAIKLMDGLGGCDWRWWRGANWASLWLLGVHSPCQIGSMARGNNRHGRRSFDGGGAMDFAKCLFC
jgi:hypothetical protein